MAITQPPPEGRYNDRSPLNRQSEHWAHMLTREGEPWEPAEDDELLECYLVRRLTAHYGGHESYARYLGRSYRAVDTRAWKLVALYGGINYLRGPRRTDRSGMPFDERDRRVFYSLFSDEAAANGALASPDHLANLLARSPSEVTRYASDKARRLRSITGPAQLPGEGKWEWAVRTIAKALAAGRVDLNFSLGAS